MTITDLEAVNLDPDRLAALVALAEALTRIGMLRTGERSGQFSIHNFRLRAAYDANETLVVLMRAGIWRRHTWFCAVRNRQTQMELAVPRPMERDWEWWRGVEEIRDRLIASEVWQEAVGDPFDALQNSHAQRLREARLLVGKGRLPEGF